VDWVTGGGHRPSSPAAAAPRHQHQRPLLRPETPPLLRPGQSAELDEVLAEAFSADEPAELDDELELEEDELELEEDELEDEPASDRESVR
jgi:hypothetical protein